MTLASGTRLGHYEIRSKIGEGGMGEVYQAQDTKLDRKVALKILPADLASNQDRMRRFVQEAKAASALNHPNIITIYEIDETQSGHFIATEFIEGETLRERESNAPLKLLDSLDIATQIASALSAAHGAGIVHRDIKPDNVMIRRDCIVKVLDFGLAKLTSPASPDSVDGEAPTRANVKTDPGVVMGTAIYMSPEQARGLPVDARTDIFSFGIVLYEMVAGRLPFDGSNRNEIMASVLSDKEPQPLTRYSSEAPTELGRIVLKALRKNRDERYQTIKDMLLDLQDLKKELEFKKKLDDSGPPKTDAAATAEPTRLTATTTPGIERHVFLSRRAAMAGAVLVLMIAVAIAYVLVFRRSGTLARLPEVKSLAVLPLENLSGDPAQDYFADGMTEALISNLAQIRALRVISRTSVMRYKGSNKSLPEIARELNVDAVIEGSVQHSSGSVRVSTRLVPAAADSPTWSRVYDRDESDVLKLESEVARAVADEIRIQVTADERARLAAARSINPQAQEAYLLGRYHFNRYNQEDSKRAIEYFERAIQLAPDYAAAFAGLSDACSEQGIWKNTFKELESRARTAALKAIELDEQLAEAHVSLAKIELIYDLEWTTAEQEFKRALDLNPGSVDAHIYYGLLLSSLARDNEAIQQGQIAGELDPLSSGASVLGRFLYRARRYQEAVPYLQRGIELEPRSARAYYRLGDTFAKLGRYDEAIATYGKVGELAPNSGYKEAGIAYVYALMGRQREARQMISGLKAEPMAIAQVYSALGDKDEAFRILEKAIEDRLIGFYLKEDPPFENLYSDPRWKELLRRMNYPPG